MLWKIIFSEIILVKQLSIEPDNMLSTLCILAMIIIGFLVMKASNTKGSF